MNVLKPSNKRLKEQIKLQMSLYYIFMVCGVIVSLFNGIHGLMFFSLGVMSYLSQKQDKIRLEIREMGGKNE